MGMTNYKIKIQINEHKYDFKNNSDRTRKKKSQSAEQPKKLVVYKNESYTLNRECVEIQCKGNETCNLMEHTTIGNRWVKILHRKNVKNTGYQLPQIN